MAFWVSVGLILLSRLLLAAFGVELGGDDGHRYLQEAVNLVDHGVFSHEPGPSPQPTAHDLPLYPLVLAAIHLATGDAGATARVACLVNAVLFVLAAAGVHAFALRLVDDRRAALAALWVFALLPAAIPYSVFHMPESLFLALFVWSQVFLLGALRDPSWRSLLAAFGLLGLATLAKPITVFYPALAGALVLVGARQLAVGARVSRVAAGVALVLAILSPWVLRNRAVFGVAGLSTITGTNLFDWNYRLLLEDRLGPDAARSLEDQRDAALRPLGPPPHNPFLASKALAAPAKAGILADLPGYLAMTARRHPRLYLGTAAVASLRLLGSPAGQEAYDQLHGKGKYPSLNSLKGLPLPVLLAHGLGTAALIGAYTLAAAGLAILARRRHWLPLLILAGALAYFAAVIGPVVSTRYRLAMDPFLATAAGIACAACRPVSRLRAARARLRLRRPVSRLRLRRPVSRRTGSLPGARHSSSASPPHRLTGSLPPPPTFSALSTFRLSSATLRPSRWWIQAL